MTQVPYLGKPAEYFANVRQPVLDAIPRGSHRVLEIGSGDGATLRACKVQGRASTVVGIELVESAARRSRAVLDQVLIGDVEELVRSEPLGEFDYIIAADVLEHTLDPWSLVLVLKGLLTDSGAIVSTMPNIRNWRILRELVFRGRWEYAESGILDRTHLRFFTRQSMVAMFTEAGLSVVTVESIGAKSARVARRLPKGLAEVATPQYLIVARKL